MVNIRIKELRQQNELTQIVNTKTEELPQEEIQSAVDAKEFLRFRRLLQQRKGRHV